MSSLSSQERQTSAEKRAEKRKKDHQKRVEAFKQTIEFEIAEKENALDRQNSYERKLRAWKAEPPEVRYAKKERRLNAKMKRQESEERRKAAEFRRQASEERRRLSDERKSSERKALERQRQIETGELVVGTPYYYTPVVQGNVSFNKLAAEMDEMIASNRDRHSKTAKEYPGLFGMTRKAFGKKHKKRKTYKKRKGHKKSRKH
jgi:hypothetical protein